MAPTRKSKSKPQLLAIKIQGEKLPISQLKCLTEIAFCLLLAGLFVCLFLAFSFSASYTMT